LASTAHLFYLKGSEIGRIKIEWVLDINGVKSFLPKLEGLLICAYKSRNIFGINFSNQDKENNILLPFEYNTTLYLYFNLNIILQKIKKIQKKVSIASALDDKK
jgi:hypothetical protein